MEVFHGDAARKSGLMLECHEQLYQFSIRHLCSDPPRPHPLNEPSAVASVLQKTSPHHKYSASGVSRQHHLQFGISLSVLPCLCTLMYSSHRDKRETTVLCTHANTHQQTHIITRKHLLFHRLQCLTGLFVSVQCISGALGIVPYSSGTSSDRDAV